MNEDKISQFIDNHPRACLYFIAITVMLIWQTVPALVAIIVFLLVRKKDGSKHGPLNNNWKDQSGRTSKNQSKYTFKDTLKRAPWLFLTIGMLLVTADIICFYQGQITTFIKVQFVYNKYMISMIYRKQYGAAISYFMEYSLDAVLSLPWLFVGCLQLIALVPDHPHQAALFALQKGELSKEKQELSDKDIKLLLAKITESDKEAKSDNFTNDVREEKKENEKQKQKEEKNDGTLLGISKYTGSKVVIPDHYINQVALVLGTTGSGKTITLRRFYQRAIREGCPLIIVDGKPDAANINWLMALSQQHGREFCGFNCGNYQAYDPLAEGGYTELKDKIICLKDEWANEYYRSIAEDYLQTTIAALLKSNEKLSLRKIVSCLNYDELIALSRQIKDSELHSRIEALGQYDRKDITGLQAHLNILLHSELGQYFQSDANAIKLSHAIANQNVVYFALPALRFPSFSKVLGKLVINDLKAVVDRYTEQNAQQKEQQREERKQKQKEGQKEHKKQEQQQEQQQKQQQKQKIFTVFDEFSVFAGEQVLNLVNMGRGKGIHAIFGTQGLADLTKVDKTFKDQLLNCTNTLICHRLNDQGSAEDIANWVGTNDTFTVTAQLNLNNRDDKMGNIKNTKEFIIHPDAIKQSLKTGEAFYVTKVERFEWDKVKVII